MISTFLFCCVFYINNLNKQLHFEYMAGGVLVPVEQSLLWSLWTSASYDIKADLTVLRTLIANIDLNLNTSSWFSTCPGTGE